MDELDCTKALLALYEFLDGELTTERREHISGHLDGCPHCFSAFDFEAELRIVVRSRVRSQVPAELLNRIAESIEREAAGAGPGDLASGGGPSSLGQAPGTGPTAGPAPGDTSRQVPRGPGAGLPGMPGS